MGASYAQLTDVRSQGITVAQASDANVTDRLEIASRVIDGYTGTLFTSTVQTVTVSDVRNPLVILPKPFASITSVTVNSQVIDPSAYITEPWGLRLYLSGALDVDGFPRRTQTYVTPGTYRNLGPYGSQVAVTATFGYASVPTPVRHACTLVTVFLLSSLGQMFLEHRVQQLKVEGYDIRYFPRNKDDLLNTTGVEEADRLLLPYRADAVPIV